MENKMVHDMAKIQIDDPILYKAIKWALSKKGAKIIQKWVKKYWFLNQRSGIN